MIIGYSAALAATVGFLALALSKPRTSDQPAWSDDPPRGGSGDDWT